MISDSLEKWTATPKRRSQSVRDLPSLAGISGKRVMLIVSKWMVADTRRLVGARRRRVHRVAAAWRTVFVFGFERATDGGSVESKREARDRKRKPRALSKGFTIQSRGA